jgi:hypothetical protein
LGRSPPVTTHRRDTPPGAEPAPTVDPDLIFVRDGRVYTSAGVADSYLRTIGNFRRGSATRDDPFEARLRQRHVVGRLQDYRAIQARSVEIQLVVL